jgi:hypothetical protein
MAAVACEGVKEWNDPGPMPEAIREKKAAYLPSALRTSATGPVRFSLS